MANCLYLHDYVVVIEPGGFLHKWTGLVTEFTDDGQVIVRLDRWKCMKFPFSSLVKFTGWDDYDRIP